MVHQGQARLGAVAEQGCHGFGLGRIDPGHQAEFRGGLELLQDQGDLFGALVFAPDRLHHAKAAPAIEIEANAGSEGRLTGCWGDGHAFNLQGLVPGAPG